MNGDLRGTVKTSSCCDVGIDRRAAAAAVAAAGSARAARAALG